MAPGQYWPDTDLFCAGNEETFIFLENVLTEVAEMFPGRFLHIGGDEADTREWEKCPKCQKRMREEGISEASKLQGYFTRRISGILHKLNKRLVGWDEILDSDIDKDAVVMSWRGTSGGIAAARSGRDVVMCPASHLYFDHYQLDPATQPKAFESISPLSNVYSFDPVPGGLGEVEVKHVLGVQANLWTEYVPTSEHAEYMLLPRLAALAEIAWSPQEAREWSDFAERLPWLLERYSKMGLNHSKKWA